MAVIVLASSTGAPGVTTTAVGMSLLWPRDVLLADCDRDPAQAVQAGFLQGADIAGTGLTRVVQAHREGQPVEDVLLSLTVPLAEDPYARRVFLPGFTHPGSAGLFSGIWPDLAAAMRHLGRTGMDCIVDLGRVGQVGLPPAMVAEADLICVCVRSSLRSLAAARLHLPSLNDAIGRQLGHAELGLIVVGEGRPYPAAEISGQFGLPVLAGIAWDPASAAVVSEGAARTRRFEASPFARSLRTASAALSSRVNKAAALIRGER